MKVKKNESAVAHAAPEKLALRICVYLILAPLLTIPLFAIAFGVLGAFGLAIGASLAMAVYLAPSILGAQRKHPECFQILITNVLLGWGGFGYVVTLCWAMAKTKFSSNVKGGLIAASAMVACVLGGCGAFVHSVYQNSDSADSSSSDQTASRAAGREVGRGQAYEAQSNYDGALQHYEAAEGITQGLIAGGHSEMEPALDRIKERIRYCRRMGGR